MVGIRSRGSCPPSVGETAVGLKPSVPVVKSKSAQPQFAGEITRLQSMNLHRREPAEAPSVAPQASLYSRHPSATRVRSSVGLLEENAVPMEAHGFQKYPSVPNSRKPQTPASNTFEVLHVLIGNLEVNLHQRLDAIDSSLNKLGAAVEHTTPRDRVAPVSADLFCPQEPLAATTVVEGFLRATSVDSGLLWTTVDSGNNSRKGQLVLRPEWHVGSGKSAREADIINEREEAKIATSVWEEEEASGEKPWWILAPSGRFRVIWDFMVMLIITHDMLTLPITLAFGETDALSYLAFPVQIFWTVDIPLNFITGYYVHGRAEFQQRKIFCHYLRTWFIVDLIIVAASWLSGEMSGVDFGRVGETVRIFRAVHGMKVLRLAKLRRITDELQDSVTSEYLHLLMGMVKYIFTIVWLNHFIACAWWGLGAAISNGGRNPAWTSHYGFENETLYTKYFVALHWSLTQFTPAGMEVSPQNLYERIFAVVVLLFAMVAFSSFVSSITATMTQLRQYNNPERANFNVLRRYLKSHDVHMDLSVRILHFVQYQLMKRKTQVREQQVSYLELLSKALRRELSLHIFSPVLTRHPLFRDYNTVDSEAMQQVCLEAVSQVALSPGDWLFREACHCKQMFFVMSGRLRYSSSQTRLLCSSANASDMRSSDSEDSSRGGPTPHFVERGDWCCEVCMWCPWVHTGTMTALDMADVLAIDVALFIGITGSFPMAQSFTSRYALHFAERLTTQMQEGQHIDDVLSVPEEVLEELTQRAHFKSRRSSRRFASSAELEGRQESEDNNHEDFEGNDCDVTTESSGDMEASNRMVESL